MINSGIYQWFCKENGKCYVGSAVDLKRRRLQHLHTLRHNISSCVLLQRAWNKHGEEMFDFRILEYVENKELLVEIEQYWMDFLESTNPEFGYNARPLASSNLGFKHTEESKKQMSESKQKIGIKHSQESNNRRSETLKGRVPWNKGIPHTEEWKESMKGKPAWNKGGSCTEEHKEKISKSNKGKPAWNKGMKFPGQIRKPLSEETKRKISETKLRNRTRK